MVAVIISIILVLVLVFVYMQDNNKGSGGGVSPQSTVVFGKQKGGVNNPGNLRNFNINWQGRVNSDNCEFDNFDTLANGVRAWCVNLFSKVKAGKINSTSQMIDVLTPAIAENPENARQNYKQLVSQAKSWQQLCTLVFKFEDNPSWRNANTSLRNSAIQSGLASAINYVYKGVTPQFFAS